MKTPVSQRSTNVFIRIGNLLVNYTLISALFAITCFVLYFSFETTGKGHFVVDKYKSITVSPDSLYSLSPGTLKNLRSKYLEIYQNRKVHYEKSTSDLSTIIKAMGVCCLVSLLTLYYEKKDSLSIAGIHVPFKSVFLILPVLMLYLWLSFGFTYFSALDSRQVCYVSAVKYERFSDDQYGDEFRTRRDFRMIHNLEDMGLIDGSVHYFNGFYSKSVYYYFFRNKDMDPTVKLRYDPFEYGGKLFIPRDDTLDYVVVVSLFAIFGTLFGLSIGFIIALLIRFQNLETTNAFYGKCLVRAVFLILCLSFAGFCIHRPYLLPFAGYIWVIAALVLLIYIGRLRESIMKEAEKPEA